MTWKTFTLTAGLLASAAGLAMPAAAAETSAVRDDAKVVPLSEFDVDKWKDSAWLADEMRGSDVFGKDGEQIGTVQSIVVSKDGMVERLVVETGGFLDIGDKVIAVPWSGIDLTPGKEGVVAKNVDESNVEDFSLFGDREEATTGPRSFRAAELAGDFVTLKGGEGYGYVRDLLFDRDGKLQAIVVAPDVAYDAAGYYAYPYHGYGYDYGFDFDPGLDYYALPYSQEELAEYHDFDYDVWEDGIL
ncbi:MAG TPA: PRC-barrel domain-containing protein [Geminicoccaceae bacterium]|nr:PRC-barrel domain-containing protein [Geminicoccaceae bacterium]